MLIITQEFCENLCGGIHFCKAGLCRPEMLYFNKPEMLLKYGL